MQAGDRAVAVGTAGLADRDMATVLGRGLRYLCDLFPACLGARRAKRWLLLLLRFLSQLPDPRHPRSAPLNPTISCLHRPSRGDAEGGSVPRCRPRDVSQYSTGSSWSHWWGESREEIWVRRVGKGRQGRGRGAHCPLGEEAQAERMGQLPDRYSSITGGHMLSHLPPNNPREGACSCPAPQETERGRGGGRLLFSEAWRLSPFGAL